MMQSIIDQSGSDRADTRLLVASIRDAAEIAVLAAEVCEGARGWGSACAALPALRHGRPPTRPPKPSPPCLPAPRAPAPHPAPPPPLPPPPLAAGLQHLHHLPCCRRPAV